MSPAAPVRIYAANLDFTKARELVRRHLEHLLDSRPAVVVGAQEAKRFRLARLVRSALVRQEEHDDNLARRGTAILTRGLATSPLRLYFGARSSATLPRYIATATIRLPLGGYVAVLSAHVPPRRAGVAAQDRFLRRLKARIRRFEANGRAWAVCIDANRNLARVAAELGGIAYGSSSDRIVGIVASPRLVVSTSGVDSYGRAHGLTDHLAPWIEVISVRAEEAAR